MQKLIVISLIIITLILCAFLTLYECRNFIIKEFKKKQHIKNAKIVLYTQKAQPFYIFHSNEKRKYVSLNEISWNLQKAVIAIEDERFLEHSGFDIIRILGVLWELWENNAQLQGASTITQQLVKLTLLSQKRSFIRKIKEIGIAILLETFFSKQQILEYYLNTIYLGHRNYGVENAAINYFGKSAKNLNLAESALLAGLIKKPEGYSPFNDSIKTLQRQKIVLDKMLALKCITLKQYLSALKKKIIIQNYSIPKTKQIAPYFAHHIFSFLTEKYGKETLENHSLKIQTTLDLSLQLAMEKVIQGRTQRPRSFHQIAGVSLDPRTGFIKAMVGGINFEESAFNHVTQAKRQPGSAFKPILYAAAITAGILPNDIFIDEPLVNGPENYTGKHYGTITVNQALSMSNNVVSVKILKKIGFKRLYWMAKKFGIPLNHSNNLSLALGVHEVTLLQLVKAYGAFANHGIRYEPVFILKINNYNGKILNKYTPQFGRKVLTPRQNQMMLYMLQNVVLSGTGRNARIKQLSAGKTGTSDQYRDAWYIGFTKNLVTGFWVGNDNNRFMDKITGGKEPAKLWKKYMELISEL